MWGPLLLWMLGHAKDPRTRRAASWIGLAVILMGIANATTTAAVVIGAARLSLGFLGGVYRTWSRAYNGSQFYSTKAAAELGRVARLVAAGQQKAAQTAFDAWLLAFDPLGAVRAAIERDEIESDDSLFREVPK